MKGRAFGPALFACRLRLRSRGYPSATVNNCDFGPLRIAYDARVLEPRRWTRLQSDWAAELSPLLPEGAILELCAGAGQIGLLAAVLTGRALVQVDVDPAAGEFARANARRAGVTDYEMRVAPLDAALHEHERFPLILADPPYVRSAEVAAFPEDPVRAIDGGEDGLTLIENCVRVAEAHLCDRGVALLQVRGAAQANQLPNRALRVSEIRAVDEERAVVKLNRG